MARRIHKGVLLAAVCAEPVYDAALARLPLLLVEHQRATACTLDRRSGIQHRRAADCMVLAALIVVTVAVATLHGASCHAWYLDVWYRARVVLNIGHATRF